MKCMMTLMTLIELIMNIMTAMITMKLLPFSTTITHENLWGVTCGNAQGGARYATKTVAI